MLHRDQILEVFKQTGVMLEGHFQLTSGRHSAQYMQCAHLFEDAKVSELLCAQLAKQFEGQHIDYVVGPALGAITMAYEVSRALGVKNFFAEREDGKMTFRRGFALPKGARVLVVEDAMTTGGSVKEVIALVQAVGAEAIGVAVMVDRTNGKVDLGVPLHSLIQMQIESHEPGACPLCEAGLALVKPGSRTIKA